MLKQTFSVAEAADVVGVSTALIYGLCSSKRIRYERHGLRRGRIRIPEDALDEYRKSRTVEVLQPQPAQAPSANSNT